MANGNSYCCLDCKNHTASQIPDTKDLLKLLEKFPDAKDFDKAKGEQISCICKLHNVYIPFNYYPKLPFCRDFGHIKEIPDPIVLKSMKSKVLYTYETEYNMKAEKYCHMDDLQQII